jgi:hypothetical protein
MLAAVLDRIWRNPMNRSQNSSNTIVKVLAIAFGAVFTMGLFAAALSDEGAGSSYGTGSSYQESSFVESATSTGTEIYDSGSITTTDDGEMIYSDSDGNSFSTGW